MSPKRAGFTLIEILIVVGIIVIMLSTAVMSVASGRGAVKVKEATRGVIQLSRYASALALLRQKPVVVTFFSSGKIEVRISGELTGLNDVGTPADPIYREVEGAKTLTAEEVAEEDKADALDDAEGVSRKRSENSGDSGGAEGKKDEKKGFFYTRQVLDPEVLAQEDAYGEYEGVTFEVEVLGEDGEPLEYDLAMARSLPRPKREESNASFFIDGQQIDIDVDKEDQKHDDRKMICVTYETNGNVNPHRIIVRLEDEAETSEGFAINISRSGKATVGDAEDEDDRRGGRRVRRNRRR